MLAGFSRSLYFQKGTLVYEIVNENRHTSTHKLEGKTAYKRQASMSDVTSPEPNVRNDSTPAFSTLSVAQGQESYNGTIDLDQI